MLKDSVILTIDGSHCSWDRNVINNIDQYVNDLNSIPEIRKTALDKNILKKLLERLKNPHVSDAAKNHLIKKLAGGFCCDCEGIPTMIVSYDVDGAQLIQKYCDKCFKKWDKLEKKRLRQ